LFRVVDEIHKILKFQIVTIPISAYIFKSESEHIYDNRYLLGVGATLMTSRSEHMEFIKHECFKKASHKSKPFLAGDSILKFYQILIVRYQLMFFCTLLVL